MAQTRMFRDRVVSMEQTLEGGEKHLELLKALCSEAMPDFAYAGHVLDHERDLFVLELSAADGRKKSVAFTRMVLFDAERIPAIAVDPSMAVREKLVGFLRSRSSRPEILVTFRHVEDGWVDTPEARPSRRRGRRGGRVGKGPAFAQAPAGRSGFAQAAAGVGQGRPAGLAASERPGGSQVSRPAGGAAPAGRPAPAPPAPGASPGRSGRRRRSRRRRRGGGAGPAGGAPAPHPRGTV